MTHVEPIPPTLSAPTPHTRRRPFGVLVVAVIQLGTVAVALLGSVAGWVLPWEGVFIVYLQEHAIARGVIMAAGIAVLVAVVGLWRLRYWGWALMVAIVGLSLVLDLTTWWQVGERAGLALYVRLTLDVVSAFYLNTSTVQAAFREPTPEPAHPGFAGTEAAGRVDP